MSLAQQFAELAAKNRTEVLIHLRAVLQDEIFQAKLFADDDREDNLVAVMALVDLAIPEVGDCSPASARFVFNEVCLAVGSSAEEILLFELIEDTTAVPLGKEGYHLSP